jgi:hypothetical protein
MTHPDIASLVDLLFAFGGKRVRRIMIKELTFFHACGREGGPA